MGEFTKRLIFGSIFMILVIIATTNAIAFIGIFYFFMIFCTYEFNNLQQNKSLIPYIINSVLFTIGISIVTNLFVENENLIKYYFVTLLLITFTTFIIALFSKSKNPIKSISSTFLSLIYIGLPFLLILIIHKFYPNVHGATYKVNLILSIFILIWANDTFAYLVGKNFGKHKLFERISPKKTIEGFIGGFVFTILTGFVLGYINSLQMQDESFTYNYSHWIIIAIIISIFGTIGDLIESMFKRQANIKDSSNLIPGHGGFLDRLDTFIFAVPFIFIYLFIYNHVS